VLVETTARDQVKQLHERVAQSLEKNRRDRLGEIALHYDAAGEAADAYRTAQLAAKAAERVYAPAAAGAYLQIAARNSTTPAELAEIRVALAQVAETAGRHDEVEELCDLTIEWFDGQGDMKRALSLRRIRERARMEQGQPVRVTLEALSKLDAQAIALGDERERVALLMMASQAYGRLGDQRRAATMAQDSVTAAEKLGDNALLADAHTRFGLSVVAESPADARHSFDKALRLFDEVGDVRGQARGHTHLGIAALFEARLDDAQHAFSRAIAVARAAGVADIWGLASQNLGVLLQKRGEYDRARELFGDALALFAAVKHSEFQLIALYNMAHVERELGLWESAAELYDATIPLAQRIGHSEVEIGAIAGAGLCQLELARIVSARGALTLAEARLAPRPDWFQGRELAEALAIRMHALDGNMVDALSRFDRALTLAEATDMYNAAWLTVACADALLALAPDRVRASIDRYRDRVRQLGYPEMTRRYEALVTP
jgi:tetratricopeptide (TPR) repeat protein